MSRHLRPGDKHEAQITRARRLDAPHTDGKEFYIVTVAIDRPHSSRPYFTQVSWSVNKMGGYPVEGAWVEVEFTEPPFEFYRNQPWVQGKFRITKHIPKWVSDREHPNPCGEIFLEKETTMKTLIGRVERDFHRAATYVRVAVPGHDGVPLCLKATRGVFDRDLFKKGVVVEVARSNPNDATKFHVVKVFNETTGEVDLEELYCPDTTLTRTKHVKFYVGSRYFNDANLRDRMIRVLAASFGIEHCEANRICRGLGTWVVCREEQFARFMINRDAAAIPNGFQDLRVTYVDSEPGHVVDVTKRDTGC